MIYSYLKVEKIIFVGESFYDEHLKLWATKVTMKTRKYEYPDYIYSDTEEECSDIQTGDIYLFGYPVFPLKNNRNRGDNKGPYNTKTESK
jgi:hypothetical protein